MLQVHDVHTYYGDSYVLQGVSLDAPDGRVTAVLGRNGVGKSTLCRSIFGLTPARRGHIRWNGSDITSEPTHRIQVGGLGLVPQGRRIFPSLTVEENLLIAARPGSGDRHWDLAKAYGVFPRLAERRQNRGNELSGGEQQMLAIARALISNPAMVVMDEPTEGLSPAMVSEVAGLIRRLKEEGTAVLLAEQNAAFAVKVADYVHVMSGGRIVYASDPVALWENTEVRTQLLGVPGTMPAAPAPDAGRG
jgi:branched-chain amino acid transport system ATP-binding protein